MTTWNIGGHARYLARPRDADEVSKLIRQSIANDCAVRILGGGSNVLIADGELKALVMLMSDHKCADSVFVNKEANQIIAEAGVSLARVLQVAAKNGLSGLEQLAGIPGTLGGAVKMNAGGGDWGIGCCVENVSGVNEQGEVVCRKRDELKFSYRSSLSGLAVITRVCLQLSIKPSQTIREQMTRFIEMKRHRQPISNVKSAGCVFKNPDGLSAGKLIDDAGLKGFSYGDAIVSQIHANFIVNKGKASFADIMQVIDHVRETVFQQQGIELQLEVDIWS